WSSIYSAMSVAVKCSTPYDTDINGWSSRLDILLTVGNYRPLYVVLPTLRLKLQRNPCAIVALSGSEFEHGVPAAAGDRACAAYCMRANVHSSA
ncbi:hypothetical protein EDD16DRAFT_1470035, partial [Pisolithus croceorrhizus]